MISPPASPQFCTARHRLTCFFFTTARTFIPRTSLVLENRGFTMVELVVSMGIIGVLVLLAIPGYVGIQDRAREARAETEIRDIEKAINAYAIDRGAYPTGLADIGRLGAKDPWGRAYIYDPSHRLTDAIGQFLNPESFDLYSNGIDGATREVLDTDPGNDTANLPAKDDIVRGGDGGYVGERGTYLPAL